MSPLTIAWSKTGHRKSDINKFLLPSLPKKDKVPITNFRSKLLLSCRPNFQGIDTLLGFACLLDTKVRRMEKYLKAGFQTNESEEILFIGLQEEVERGGRPNQI